MLPKLYGNNGAFPCFRNQFWRIGYSLSVHLQGQNLKKRKGILFFVTGDPILFTIRRLCLGIRKKADFFRIGFIRPANVCFSSGNPKLP